MNLLTDVLQSQITRLQEEIRGLASWRTGIVESVDPPTVLFPRDTVATPADTLTQSITPGQVVLTLTLMRRVWIIGIRGGRQTTGFLTVTAPAADIASGNIFRSDPFEVPIGKPPPTGYRYQLVGYSTSNGQWYEPTNFMDTANPTMTRRSTISQSGTGTAYVSWTLISTQ